MTDDKSELREKIAYKLFMAYDSGTRALLFDDLVTADQIITLFEYSKQSEWVSVEKYLQMRIEQAEHHIQVEKLSGNTVKKQIEKAVLAELVALQAEILPLPSPPEPIETEI